MRRADVVQQLLVLRASLDDWHSKTNEDLDRMHASITSRIDGCRSVLVAAQQGFTVDAPQRAAPTTPPNRQLGAPGAGAAGGGGPEPKTPPSRPYAAVFDEMESDWGTIGQGVMTTPPPQSKRDFTPTGSPQSAEKLPLEAFFSRGSTGNSPEVDFETLYAQLTQDDSIPRARQGGTHGAVGEGTGTAAVAEDGIVSPSSGSGDRISVALLAVHGQHQTSQVQLEDLGDSVRSRVVPVSGAAEPDDPAALNIDITSKCQVLVEFKRKRVLQFDSSRYVGPGQFVFVGGDRGEDIGLVIYTWCETRAGTVKGIGLRGASLTRSIGVGNGVVRRLANNAEVSQLHRTNADLEGRAVEVCQHRVLEFGLPMVIVDAEYQFDKKKLTFYYEAQQRLDFRDLVRDLFKTFRARIWMEPVEG